MALADVELNLVTSLDDVLRLKEWLGRRRELNAIGLDTETSGLHWNDKVRLIQVGDDAAGWAFARDDWLGLLKDLINTWEGDWLLHNAPFDTGALSRDCGVEVPRSRVHDSMVRARINESHMAMGLKSQAARHVDPAAAGLQAELAGTKWTWANVPITYAPYWCVPKTTEILTRTGWKKWDEIKVNEDETLGYEDGRLRWTLITGIHDPGVAPVVKFGNQYWSTLCTPNHRWVMRKGDDVGIHPLNEGWTTRKGVTKLVRSAPADGGDSPLTPDEAAVLAWVLSDGTYAKDDPTYGTSHVPQATGGACIVQSNKKYVQEIRDLLNRENACTKEYPREGGVKFNVKVPYFRALWKKAQLDELSLLEIVFTLSEDARTAWVDAWIKAEGDMRGSVISQNRGPKLDALAVSLYMQGHAIHGHAFAKDDKCVRFRYSDREPTPQKTHYTPAGHADVWCPTTGNSTWTARDETGNIFVTGNTYGALDPVLTYMLELHHRPITEAEAPAAYDLEMGVLWVVERMRNYGAHVDRDMARARLHDFNEYCEQIERWCHDEYGIKPGSNPAIITLLEDAGFSFSKQTKSGALALDAEVLEGIDHPLAESVLNRRRAQKMASTYLRFYVEQADENDLLHPSFNTLGARTSRMSCSDPNLQNLPRLGTSKFGDVVRNCFSTRHGTWDPGVDPYVNARRHGSLIMCDFDQIEMRMLAHFAQEQGMIDAFRSEGDFFVNLARQVFQDDTITKKDKRRQITKNAGYAKIYSAGIVKFAATAGIPVSQAREFLTRFDTLYPGVLRFQNTILQTAMQRQNDTGLAYARSPLTGRKYVADKRKEYALVNYLVQGAAAEVNKMKLLALDAAGLGDYMFATVHDEVLLDVPGHAVDDVIHVLGEVMNDDKLLSVPITAGVSFADRWGKKIDWEPTE